MDPLDALTTAVVWIDRSDRLRLEVTGPDRLKFLHNLTTNHIKGLTQGRGCEAFVTSPQGKTLGFVCLHALGDRILLRTDRGGLSHVLPHFEKYAVFDEVAWEDVTDRTFELHLAGPKAGALLREIRVDGPDEANLSIVEGQIAGRPVRIVRESPLGVPGLTLIGDRADAKAVTDMILDQGASLNLVALSADAFESLRIGAGTPVFGLDVTEANLPQEIGRDSTAIHFQKGCYLGQETVARLDALGHVNKILKGLRFESEAPPPPGTVLTSEGKPAGTITSTARSLRGGGAIGLGMIRSAKATNGEALRYLLNGEEQTVIVLDLPMQANAH